MTISMHRSWDLAKKHITDVVKNCRDSNDLMPHLEKCLSWGLKLKASAGCALKISLYGHDIDRAFKGRIRREDYTNYDEYKIQHALHSANYLVEYLTKINSDARLVSEVGILVKHHENEFVGGIEGLVYSDLRFLRDADSISFFDDSNAIIKYAVNHGIADTRAKIKYMNDKLTKKARARPEVMVIYQNAIRQINKMQQDLTLNQQQTKASPSTLENFL